MRRFGRLDKGVPEAYPSLFDTLNARPVYVALVQNPPHLTCLFIDAENYGVARVEDYKTFAGPADGKMSNLFWLRYTSVVNGYEYRQGKYYLNYPSVHSEGEKRNPVTGKAEPEGVLFKELFIRNDPADNISPVTPGGEHAPLHAADEAGEDLRFGFLERVLGTCRAPGQSAGRGRPGRTGGSTMSIHWFVIIAVVPFTMKLPLTMALLGLLLHAAVAVAQKRVSILFIGNSYTTYDGYNIPHKVKRMAKAAGKKVRIRQHTKNGQPLQMHRNNPRAVAKIRRRKWDYVVLQEQSWTATANAERGMYPAARSLDSLIRQQGSQTVFYLLMPKEYSQNAVLTVNGDATVYYYSVFRDFDHARDSLQQIHLKIARELGAMITPVGPAFARALAERPDLKLYRKDRVHHTRAGAYLAACVFYAALLGEQPVNVPYRGRVEPGLAQFFQDVAAQTVLGQKHLWFPEGKTEGAGD
jgi:hypothetical protein